MDNSIAILVVSELCNQKSEPLGRKSIIEGDVKVKDKVGIHTKNVIILESGHWHHWYHPIVFRNT